MQNVRLANADFDKMIIESIDEVLAFDRGTDELKFQFDQVKSGELTSNADVIYAEGRQGVQLAAFDRNKTAGFTCENGYVMASAIATQLGSELEVASSDKKMTIQIQDYFTVTEDDDSLVVKRNGATSDETKLSAADKEGTAKWLYKIGTDNSIIAKYAFADSAAAGKFSLTSGSGNKTLALPTDFTLADGENSATLLLIYDTEVSIGKKITNSGNEFAGNVKLVINFVAQDPCTSAKYLMQCIMPNAKVSGSFSLSAGNDPAVQNFEASAMLDVCSADKELFSIVMA